MHSRTAVGNGTGNAGSFRESYEMLHSLRVAPLYRILPSSLTPRILITYVPGLGLPTHLRLRLISSARSHNLLTAHLVAHPFQGLSRQRMDRMAGSRRTRTTPGCTSSVTKSNRDPVEGNRRGLHLAQWAMVRAMQAAFEKGEPEGLAAAWERRVRFASLACEWGGLISCMPALGLPIRHCLPLARIAHLHFLLPVHPVAYQWRCTRGRRGTRRRPPAHGGHARATAG